MLQVADEPIVIRGHTLLCLQGFRGEGYDVHFVDRLTEIHKALSTDPARSVQVVQAPDALCSYCPNLTMDRCELNGADSEVEIKAQDADVMRRLGIGIGIEIGIGEILSWQEILNRIGTRLKGDDLNEICGGCRWLPLGYCSEGIEKLNNRVRS